MKIQDDWQFGTRIIMEEILGDHYRVRAKVDLGGTFRVYDASLEIKDKGEVFHFILKRHPRA